MNRSIVFSVHSFRKHGQPKLTKPKELKGIQSSFSVDYIPKKCRCQVFVKGSDVWVKHRDYFSPTMKLPIEDLGKPLSFLADKYLDKKMKDKFAYPDTWGAIVLRQEAWIRIKDLVDVIKSGKFVLDIINEIRSQQEKYHDIEELELCSTNMERFWESVVFKLKEVLPDKILSKIPVPKMKLKRRFTEAGDYVYKGRKKQYKGFDML